MKVLLINGSPRKQGNTFTALSEVAKTLEKNGIEAEIVQMGMKPVRGCIACGQCKAKGNNKCVFDDDVCNRIWCGAVADAAHVFLGWCLFCTETSSRCGGVPTGWCLGCLSDDELALRDDEHACGDFAVLEHRLWPRRRTGCTGRGGHADHAYPRRKHGLVAEEDSCRRTARPSRT